MGYYMDIDTGGTFTDGFVRGDGRRELVKVDTTPHDLTLCFMECIEEAARRFDFDDASDLLNQMDTLRLSTTIGTNTLIQSNGPKLGLLVTKGKGENAYSPAGSMNPAMNFLIPEDMIIGIDEEMGESGKSIREPESVQVLAAVKNLLERGARRILVSLARSPVNPAHEEKCRELVLEDYPAHYLGSVPLLLSSEVSTELDDMRRTNAALIDAYIHQDMTHYLYKADDDVRNRRYRWPLLIVHATGGAARVAKTKAIDTCDSGPAAGLFGAAFLARLYGIENVVTIDVGGTSTDIGLIAHGQLSYAAERDMYGVPVKERVIETISFGGGGSSVAWIDNKGTLRVGPESAGAIPGPACYSLGGDKPAVTDAWVTLGYIDPDYFLGGRRKLDREQARAVIKEQIADPLKISIEEAAEAILAEMTRQSAKSVREFIARKDLREEDVAMFAFGGAGGLSCASLAKECGIPTIYSFPFGAQFCAFGSSCTDVLHTYSRIENLPLDSSSSAETIKKFNEVTKAMAEDAYFDMEGEGFSKESVSLMLEITLRANDQALPMVVRRNEINLKGEKDLSDLAEIYRKENVTENHPELFIREIRLQATSRLADPEFPEHPSTGENPEEALKDTRSIYNEGKFQDVPVYNQELLKSGNMIKGPAFVESASTTILVPSGSRYTADKYLNGLLEER
ncbi:MAG: hydantoinase/oxoprolinase family protein [Dehalococcoidales bacterium]|nr:MAG: hydantoinase/oxoprolinase family protein [Dehalococcoidales bacterium]